MSRIKRQLGRCSFCNRLVPKKELRVAGVYIKTGKIDRACKRCY